MPADRQAPGRAFSRRLMKGIGMMSNSRKVLRLPSVQGITGMARSTLYKAIKDGHFPRSISLGPRSVGWLESDIQDWLEARIAQSRSNPAAKGDRHGT